MFEKAGKHNTDKAIELAVKTAQEKKISHLVVASTIGDTARAALAAVKETAINLVIVTHAAHFRDEVQEFDGSLRKEIENAGHVVYTGTHTMYGIGRAIRNKMGWSEEDLVANTLRIFSQGVKVCVDIVAMATGAGLLPYPGKVVAVGGTGYGADTVCVVSTAPSFKFFDIKVHEIITKPYEF
jgi:uncharacterized protein